MPVMSPKKFVKLISYSVGRKIPSNHPIRQVIEESGARKKMIPLGAYFLRGLDMEGVVALTHPKKHSSDGLDHYLFTWFSNEDVSVSEEAAHTTLQIKSVIPPQFSLRGKPDMFVRLLGESTMIQSILVELIDDLKCIEGFTIFNKHGSQRDAMIPIPPELIGTRFMVQTFVSEEATTIPSPKKLERMEIVLPQLIDLANFAIMTGVKMYGPMTEFTNFCTQCGKKLPSGENQFCIHCGESLLKS